MKFVQTLVSAIVCGFVLMLATAAHAQSTTKQYATIVRIVGQARYSAGDNVWHPLSVGQTLGAGNVIQTAANSKVDLVLGDKITAHITSDNSRPAADGRFWPPACLDYHYPCRGGTKRDPHAGRHRSGD